MYFSCSIDLKPAATCYTRLPFQNAVQTQTFDDLGLSAWTFTRHAKFQDTFRCNATLLLLNITSLRNLVDSSISKKITICLKEYFLQRLGVLGAWVLGCLGYTT